MPVILPPVIQAVPLVTTRLSRVTLDSSIPPVILVSPVTAPPVSVVLPLEIRELKVPPVTFNVEAVTVSPVTLPPVMIAVPLVTTRLSRVTLDSSIPPVILVRPATAPPVSVVLPLEVSEFSVPPVTFNVEAETVSPVTLPPMILATPLVTVRFESVVFDVSVPPVTFARSVTVPPVRVVLPLDVRAVSVPPVTFNVEAEMVFPLTFPPVITAVPLVTVRLSRVTFDSKTPPVIFVRPATLPPVKVVLPLDIRAFSVPPVTFNMEAEMVSPLMLPPVIMAVPLVTTRLSSTTLDSNSPPVIFVRPATLPPVKLVLPLDMRAFSVPPVTFNVEAEMVSQVTFPPVIFAVPLVTVRHPRVTLDVRVPPVTLERPLILPPVRVVVPLVSRA